MLRWTRTLAMIAALSPSLVSAAAPTPTVKLVKPRSPYLRGAADPRWVLPPPRAAIAPRLSRVDAAVKGAAASLEAEAAHQRRILALAHARACKVFDRNASGTPDGGEPLVGGWRIRLGDARGGAEVRTTDWDGCARFAGLRPGRYTLREILPPLWDPGASEEVSIDVREPTGLGGADAPTYFTSGCVHHARLGGAEFWRGQSGMRLLDEQDQRRLNALAPFRSPSAAFAAGDEPFDGRFADGVTPVRGAFERSRSWGRGTWQAEVALFLGDRRVSADPRGRLAQEILVFTLNSRHFLERAQVVILDDVPIFVDDLLFEGVLAWHGDSPSWNHDVTALLAALNSMNGLRYVPRDQCQVAYVPF